MQSVFYTRLQRRLHWLVIVMLGLQYLLQQPMIYAVEVVKSQSSLSFIDFAIVTLHSWGGLVIAGVMIWRWQLRRRFVPVADGSLPPLVDRIVRIHHVALYVIVLAMALTGAMHYYFDLGFAAEWHAMLKWVLALFVGLHVAGAVFHATQGSTVFQRMMGRDSLR